jgi:ATP-dependent Clp protease ATP-binding subunit ClpX
MGDLTEFGLIHEFVGRLHVTATLNPLSEDDLVSIMLEPKNAIVKQYQKMFEMEDATLEFPLETLREVSKSAIERKTGARALRSLFEDFMLDIMYDLPSNEKGAVYTITPEVVQGKVPVLVTPQKLRKSA